MSIQTTSKTLTLPPELNTFAVIAQSVQDLVQESEKTERVYAQYVKDTQETITTQAQENQKLQSELTSEKQRHAREMEALHAILEPRQLEIICYAHVGSFTCCLSFESFQAHVQADWKPYQGRMSYNHFLRFFLEQLKKATGTDAQAANDTLIAWFPLACSNLKTYEENRKGIRR